MTLVTTNEYIVPGSTLDFMLNYHHGWWRFFWHWHSENKGFHLPNLKTMWEHRKYCEDSWDKIGFGFTVWRLSFCFSCSTHAQASARYRKMFPDDILPIHALDDGIK